MKFLCNRRLCSYLILVGLLCSVSAAKQAEKVKLLEEICVVTCLPGKGPGQYIYDFKARLAPRCFGIDPNDGSFYIPEVDWDGNIRIHKFNRNGKFNKMLMIPKPEDAYPAWITATAVTLEGDIYLAVPLIPGPAILICRYSNKGKLICRFGPQGSITTEDLQMVEKVDYSYNPSVQAKFFNVPLSIFVLPKDKAFVVLAFDPTEAVYPDTFEFDGKSGGLLRKVKENANLPDKIAQYKENRLKKDDARLRMERKLGKKFPGCGYSVIGTDGHLYYMRVAPKKLEIHKVTFHE